MEKKKRGEKGSEVGGGSYGGPVARAEREKGVQGSAPHGEENGGEGAGLSDVDRHGTNVATPGCSDRGGRHTPRERGGAAATGEDGEAR
jgi:hypothetical protein